MTPVEAAALLPYLTAEERAELDSLLKHAPVWAPLKGPQSIAYHSTADIIGFGGAAGGGKGLALDTPLPTPTGWTTMADVQPGDTLLDETGQPCRVTAVSAISHRPCYRLRFDDGSELIADDVHRWVTFNAQELAALTRKSEAWRAQRRANRPSRAKETTSPARLVALAKRNAQCATVTPAPVGCMRDTATLCATLRTPSGRANHAIRMQGKFALPDADLPIPPYTLGAWLGDGTSRNGQLTSIDPAIWQRIEADGYTVRHYAWNAQQHSIIGLKVQLRAAGVLENKHIPPVYLRAGYTQRLDLLRGLMDTDGHAALDGGCEFDSTNEALADGVLHLLGTLGVKATKQCGTAKLNGRVIGPKWRIKFVTTLPVFYLPRKLERLKPTIRRTTQFRYLVACDPVPGVPTRCITVDSPTRQYLAGHSCIPTHNTDLACGKALTQHQKIMVLRRVGTELTGILDRFSDLIGNRTGYNGQDRIWRTKRHDGTKLQIEFGAVPNIGDETKYMGRPHDLLIFDEAANFLEMQIRFLMGWNRSTDPAQRCQALLTFNPPTSAEGRWIIQFFGPWLDPKHPRYPAAPGAILYAAMVPHENGTSRDVWVDTPAPFVMVGGKMVYDFNPDDFKPTEIITPKSRTFIPSRVTDNPYLAGTGYMSTLQSLPEPLRSQMLNGDFAAGVQDDPWQVIPTAWVEAAQARWVKPARLPEMLSMGIDVARGGQDNTVIARRHAGMWFDEMLVYPGAQTPNGPAVAGLVMAAMRDNAVMHVDVIGVGASPYDFLASAKLDAVGVNVSEKAGGRDASGRLAFRNKRSELWWRMREALDPSRNIGIALPPDSRLLADLTAPKWKLEGTMVQVESREQIIERIGRSPDWASAIILALIDTPKRAVIDAAYGRTGRQQLNYDPLGMAGCHVAPGTDYDPLGLI